MLVLSGEVHDLSHFGLSHLVCIDPAFPHPMIVHVEHDTGRGLPILLEEALQNVDDELHGRIVVIQDKHPVERRLLNLRLGAGYDCSPAPGPVATILFTLHPEHKSSPCFPCLHRSNSLLEPCPATRHVGTSKRILRPNRALTICAALTCLRKLASEGPQTKNPAA